MEAAAIYIDCRYVFTAAVGLDKFKKPRADFEKIVRHFTDERGIGLPIRRAYVPFRDKPERVTSFTGLLEILGFETFQYHYFDGKIHDTKWFGKMLVDTIEDWQRNSNLDGIIICAGSGGLVHIVEFFERRGLKVEVVAYGYNVNKELRNQASSFLELADFLYDAGRDSHNHGKDK